MKTSKKVERLFSFKEIAEELGVSEDELFRVALEEGLIHPDGSPTEYAIKEGILTVVPSTNLRLN